MAAAKKNGFEKGDIVQLKSGGPKMTVNSVGEDGKIYSVWFKGAALESGRFQPETLVHVPETAPKS